MVAFSSLVSAAILATVASSAPAVHQKRIAQVITDATAKWLAACTAAGGGAQCNQIQQQAILTLLAAGKNCDQQDSADDMVDIAKKLNNNKNLIQLAQIFVQQPRNAPDSLQVPYCQTEPRNPELKGLFHCQFVGTVKKGAASPFSGDQTGNKPLGVQAVNPPGSCPASKVPVPDGQQLVDITQNPRAGVAARSLQDLDGLEGDVDTRDLEEDDDDDLAALDDSDLEERAFQTVKTSLGRAKVKASGLFKGKNGRKGKGRKGKGRKNNKNKKQSEKTVNNNALAKESSVVSNLGVNDNAVDPNASAASAVDAANATNDLSAAADLNAAADPNAAANATAVDASGADPNATAADPSADLNADPIDVASTDSTADSTPADPNVVASRDNKGKGKGKGKGRKVQARQAKFPQNGPAAQKLNAKFSTLTAASPCTEGEQTCVQGGFAQCVGGKFVITQCAGGTACHALPLVNSVGTSITCTTAADAAARIAATGATGGITGA